MTFIQLSFYPMTFVISPCLKSQLISTVLINYKGLLTTYLNKLIGIPEILGEML